MPDPDFEPGSADELLHILNVQPESDNRFVGRQPAHPENEYSVYGGQLIAQSLRAAWRTVPAPFAPHSINASFFRPAPPHQPLEFDVSVERDGRTVCSRVVRARGSDKQFCSMTVSFMAPAEGPDVQASMPNVPPPEALPTGDRGKRQVREAFEFRWITEPHGEVLIADCYWARVTEPLPEDPLIHTSIVAYLSDMGVGLGDEIRHLNPSASSAPSIDHSIWFHRQVRADDWLLFDMRPINASDGRGLYTGSIYDRHGHLAATMIQEVILRYQPGQSAAIQLSL